ncbi:MAG: alpha/beta fold hydrolase [Chitinophagales bacterium]
MHRLRIIVLFPIFLIQSALFSQDIVFDGLKEINGTQLYIKIIGKGEPLLVVHGGPGLNHGYLLPHLESLAKKYQLIFYDQRSAGASKLNVKANMNFKTFADDIEAIRKEFHYDKINIICHSWAALPATTYLLNYAQNVSAIIYCSPIPLNNSFANQTSHNAIERTSSADSLKRVELMASVGFQKGDMEIINQLMMLSFKQLFCDTNKK